jgi:hypothetical protein
MKVTVELDGPVVDGLLVTNCRESRRISQSGQWW